MLSWVQINSFVAWRIHFRLGVGAEIFWKKIREKISFMKTSGNKLCGQRFICQKLISICEMSEIFVVPPTNSRLICFDHLMDPSLENWFYLSPFRLIWSKHSCFQYFIRKASKFLFSIFSNRLEKDKLFRQHKKRFEEAESNFKNWIREKTGR